MSNDREITAAALRWHTAHLARLVASAASNKFTSESKRLTGFGGSDCALSARVTSLKRTEQAAMRDLAKACAKARSQHVDDAAQVLDVDVKLLTSP